MGRGGGENSFLTGAGAGRLAVSLRLLATRTSQCMLRGLSSLNIFIFKFSQDQSLPSEWVMVTPLQRWAARLLVSEGPRTREE